jgi:hypothetical protein
VIALTDAALEADERFAAVLRAPRSEPELAPVLLGIPLNGCDPQLARLGTKSGSRKLFREAEVPLPEGFEDLHTSHEIVEALVELRARRPGIKRAVLKLDESFSGEGNALFRYPASESKAALAEALRQVEFAVTTESSETYFDKLAKMGGIVEEFIEADEKHSPSAQLRIGPRGDVFPISTHDQILGGPSGQVFLGCRFPARDDYRLGIQEAGERVGHQLSAHGVVSRFGVDFLVHRDAPDQPWKTTALEINLRMGGTTHPYLALQFLTGGALDTTTGLFLAPSGQAKYYKATDNLYSDRYRGLLPEDLVDLLTINKLHYSHGTESGVLFHLIGALSEFGKLGLTAIANSPAQVDDLYTHTLEVLDRETIYGR